MQRKFVKVLSTIMVLGILISSCSIFFIQNELAKRSAVKNCDIRLDEMVLYLENNDRDIQELTETINKEYLEKTRAFAYMISKKPEILNNISELNRIAKLMDVDQFHITDESGVLKWGTVPEIFGFDFSTNDQTKAFLPALKDKNFELAQEPAINATKGVLYQYVSVARMDKPGIVQIGMEPKRLEEAIAKNRIDVVLDKYIIGETGYAFAIDKETGTVVAHKNKDLIGKTLEEAGIDDKTVSSSKDSGIARVDGTKMIYSKEEYKGKIIFSAIPTKEIFRQRNSQIVVNFLAFAILCAVLVQAVYRLLRKLVIDGIKEIDNTLELITHGNLDAQLDVKTCPEFEKLSEQVNMMVDSIKEKIIETEGLMERQGDILEKVKHVSSNIARHSEGIKSVSMDLSQSTTEQASSIEELSATINEVFEEVENNAKHAEASNVIAIESEQKVESSNEQMARMMEAMDEITNSSEEISKIIKTIDEIAFQTNILALNAAVEAARAGEAGKGFAVVADEVRNLAVKSAEAAQNTTKLIEESITSVAKGKQIADDTAKSLISVIDSAKESADLISNITEASKKQAMSIGQISQALEQISGIVQNNSAVAQESANASIELEKESHQLNVIVNM
ncbi:MAG: methyl-accepting chemotaxis protein [Proteocatella sp.]